MAIVKVKYTRSRNHIKAHVRYITHRRGSDREKISRLLFGSDGLRDKRAAYRMIDAASRGTIFFKIMISPNPKTEDRYKDLDLQHITKQTMRQLEKQLGRHIQFIATEHNDHTQIRHIHSVVLVHGRLSKEDFQALRKIATQEASIQRKAQDRVRENPRYHALTQSVSAGRRWKRRSAKPLRLQSACPSCGYGQFTGIPSYLSYCPLCHARLKRDRTVGLRL